MNELSQKANIRLRMGVMPWQKGLDTALGFNRAWVACNMVRGTNRHLMVYNDEMRSRETYSQRLLNDLRKAVERREFKVYYQPKFNIQCDPPRLDSAEALVRWQHPELGLIPPGDFIPLFERNGVCVGGSSPADCCLERKIRRYRAGFRQPVPDRYVRPETGRDP